MKTSLARRRLAVCALVPLALSACTRPQWAKGDGAAPPPAAAAAPSGPAAAAPPPAIAAAGSPAATQGLPAWAVSLIGKSPRDAFPKNGVCRGNADGVPPTDEIPGPAKEVFGWGWDIASKRRVERVIFVDANYQIVGAGEGGRPRPDVGRVHPDVTDNATGWRGVTSLASGPMDTYGVVGNGTAICPLGHLEL